MDKVNDIVLHIDLSVMLYSLIESFLKNYKIPHGQLPHEKVPEVIEQIKTIEKVFIPYMRDRLKQEISIVEYTLERPIDKNNINFYIDIGESWRKEIEIEGIVYKDRDRKAMGHYYYLFDIAFKYYKDWVLNNNIYGSEGIEADDYMLVIANRVKDDNNILHVFWTVDADIRQVMNKNIIMFSVFTYRDRQNNIYVTNDSIVSPFDFNLFYVHQIETINPKYELLIKLLLGDKTDSIPAVIKGRFTRQEMYDILSNMPDGMVDNAYESSNGYVELVNYLYGVNTIKMTRYDDDTLTQIYNIVKLSENTLPKHILDEIHKMNKIDLSKHKKFKKSDKSKKSKESNNDNKIK